MELSKGGSVLMSFILILKHLLNFFTSLDCTPCFPINRPHDMLEGIFVCAYVHVQKMKIYINYSLEYYHVISTGKPKC